MENKYTYKNALVLLNEKERIAGVKYFTKISDVNELIKQLFDFCPRGTVKCYSSSGAVLCTLTKEQLPSLSTMSLTEPSFAPVANIRFNEEPITNKCNEECVKIGTFGIKEEPAKDPTDAFEIFKRAIDSNDIELIKKMTKYLMGHLLKSGLI